MNESQRRAWLALGLGPRWEWSGSRHEDRADGETAVLADAEGDGIGHGDRDRVGHGAPGEAGGIDVRLIGRPDPARVAPASIVDDPSVDDPPPASRPATLDERRAAIAACDWLDLRETVAACQACGLCKSRSHTVFGVGDEAADWFVLGEAPGAEEDRRGEPFVGRAGQLLDAMLAAVGMSRRSDARRSDARRSDARRGGVFIANVLKCRPPGNRDPSPDETARCEPFLQRQLELVSPKLILVVGKVAAQSLLGTEASLTSLRGRVHSHRVGQRDIPVVVTYHPAYLLRKPEDKAKAWVDLQLAMRSSREAPG